MLVLNSSMPCMEKKQTVINNVINIITNLLRIHLPLKKFLTCRLAAANAPENFE